MKDLEINLLKNEGGIYIIPKKTKYSEAGEEREYFAEEKEKLFLVDVLLVHSPYCQGLFEIIKISDEKKVLFCKKCGLRVSFSHKIETIKELKDYLSKTYLFD